MVSEFASILHELVLDNPVPAKDLAKSIGKPYSTLLREVNPSMIPAQSSARKPCCKS